MNIRRLFHDLHIDFTIDTEGASNSTFIVRPNTTTEVSNIFTALSPLVEAKEVSVHLHGANFIPKHGITRPAETVILDLRLLTGISLDLDKTAVRIHVGETWSSVQRELEKHGLTLPGSTFAHCSKIHIIDTSLDTGLIYFTGKGISRDCIQEFEIVLTSGAVLRANAVKNAARWEAMRAGLDDGAVITSFTVRTCASATIHGGIAHYAPESFALLAEAAVLFAKTESSSGMRVMFSAGYGYGHRLNTCCYFRSEDTENHALLQPFASLPGRVQSYVTTQSKSDTTICEELYDANAVAVRYASKHSCLVHADRCRSLNATFTVRPDLALILDIYQEWLDISIILGDVGGHMFSIAFSPTTKSIQPKARVNNEVNEIELERGMLFTAMLSSTWTSLADDKRVRGGIDMILAKCWAMSRKRHLQYGSIFADYANYSGSVIHGYGGKKTKFPS